MKFVSRSELNLASKKEGRDLMKNSRVGKSLFLVVAIAAASFAPSLVFETKMDAAAIAPRWKCPGCARGNLDQFSTCLCGSPKPGVQQAAAPAGPVASKVWMCSECGSNPSATGHKTCDRCFAAKRLAVAGTRPIPAGKWKCPNCEKLNPDNSSSVVCGGGNTATGCGYNRYAKKIWTKCSRPGCGDYYDPDGQHGQNGECPDCLW